MTSKCTATSFISNKSSFIGNLTDLNFHKWLHTAVCQKLVGKNTKVHVKTLEGIVGCFQVMAPKVFVEVLENITSRKKH